MLRPLQISTLALLWLLAAACDGGDNREMATGSGAATSGGAVGSGDSVSDGGSGDNSNDPGDGGQTPDANLVVTYEEVVKPIIDNACVNCHNEANRAQAANLTLENFNALRTAYGPGMLARINSDATPMPPAAPQEVRADIARLLQAWEAQGFRERIIGGGQAE